MCIQEREQAKVSKLEKSKVHQNNRFFAFEEAIEDKEPLHLMKFEGKLDGIGQLLTRRIHGVYEVVREKKKKGGGGGERVSR